ncbi:uracil-DNA glycosylase [Streptacidiphilus rugosus]|uniref:uracil-DNA glycosylase n=1 Tax=Streptacidiphilus rugosus TaxID=405783 RepID=UPI0005637976|nr:uracil-DNA glycosylase [Streptacidiphilus rugosus]
MSTPALTDEFVLPESWRDALQGEIEQPYFGELAAFVAAEREAGQVFPPRGEVFAALESTPLSEVKVLLLGQDPYHDDNQAHGMCFSVRRGVKVPPSLRNIYKELASDIEVTAPKHGNLQEWADQGVLLLNAVLTVRAHEAGSHAGKGWEKFTDAVIKAVSARPEPVVFVLWGGYAKKKLPLIDTSRHVVVQSGHPSPLSARHFLGTKPFSQIDKALADFGQKPINWQLSD